MLEKLQKLAQAIHDGQWIEPVDTSLLLEVYDVDADYKPSKNAYRNKKSSLLHLACQVGNEEAVRNILSRLKNIEQQRNALLLRDHRGRTPLHMAASTGNVKLLELLESADWSVTNNKGRTPLHSAAKHHRAEAVHYLVPKTQALRDSAGLSPFGLLQKRSSWPHASMLFSGHSKTEFTINYKEVPELVFELSSRKIRSRDLMEGSVVVINGLKYALSCVFSDPMHPVFSLSSIGESTKLVCMDTSQFYDLPEKLTELREAIAVDGLALPADKTLTEPVEILGFGLGGFVAQMIYLKNQARFSSGLIVTVNSPAVMGAELQEATLCENIEFRHYISKGSHYSLFGQAHLQHIGAKDQFFIREMHESLIGRIKSCHHANDAEQIDVLMKAEHYAVEGFEPHLNYRNGHDYTTGKMRHEMLIASLKNEVRAHATPAIKELLPYQPLISPQDNKKLFDFAIGEYLFHYIAYEHFPIGTEITVPSVQDNQSYPYRLQRVIHEHGLFCYALKPSDQRNEMIIIFQGTELSVSSIRRDLEKSGAGFKSFRHKHRYLMNELAQLIGSNNITTLTIGGHSLGGADAQNCFVAVLAEMARARNLIPPSGAALFFAKQPPADKAFEKITAVNLMTYNAANPPASTRQLANVLIPVLKEADIRLHGHIQIVENDVVSRTGSGHVLAEVSHEVCPVDLIKFVDYNNPGAAHTDFQYHALPTKGYKLKKYKLKDYKLMDNTNPEVRKELLTVIEPDEGRVPEVKRTLYQATCLLSP